MFAAYNGNIKAMDILLQNNVDVNIQDKVAFLFVILSLLSYLHVLYDRWDAQP